MTAALHRRAALVFAALLAVAYRKAMPRARALAELRAGAGTQFDGAVVETFADVLAARPVAVA